MYVKLERRLAAQEVSYSMIEKWQTAIPPLTGDEERTVTVYVPDIAESDPEARFPVLYMFDGHNVFFDEDATYGKCWGMKEYMEETEAPMIVVGVECNHHPDHGRLKEYSPYNFREKSIGTIIGKGKTMMDWMVQDFKPLIDEMYPTLPGREATFIAGSSMGGLMSLYAVTAYNDTFSRAACLSPSLWTSPKRVKQFIAKADIAPGTVIYMDYGSCEMARRDSMLKAWTHTCSQLLEKGVWLTGRIVPGGEHCEASWEEQIPFFVNTLLYTRQN